MCGLTANYIPGLSSEPSAIGHYLAETHCQNLS